MSAGFGKPNNRTRTDKVHWWNEDGKPACDLDSSTGFIGLRISSSDVTAQEVCVTCLALVTSIFGVNKIP